MKRPMALFLKLRNEGVSDSVVLVGWCFLFAYISLVPFYYLQPLQLVDKNPPFYLPKYLPPLLIGLLTCLALVGWTLGRFRPLRTPLDLYAGSYLIVTGVGLTGATYLVIGAMKLFYYTLTGIYLPYLVVSQFSGREAIHKLIRWATGVAAAVALYGICVYASGSYFFWGQFYEAYNPYYGGADRAASTLGNAVFTGSYLALCLPFSLWAFDSERSRGRKMLFGMFTLLIMIGLGLTFTRGAWLAAAVACVIFLRPRANAIWQHARRVVNIHRVVIFLTVVLLLVPVLEGLGFKRPIHQTWTGLWSRVGQSFQIRSTESFRLAQYGTALRVLRERPLLGVGFGNFTRLFEKYKDPSTPPIHLATTTESMYLMFACETGLLGLVAVLFVFYAVIHALYGAYRAAPPGPERDLLVAALGAFSGFLLNMGTWDALNQPTVRMTFWMFVGIAFAQMNTLSRRTRGPGPG